MTDILIIGAGKTGTTLAKELARFVATWRNGPATYGNGTNLFIFDEGKITSKDVKEGFYLPEDKGFCKGETAAMILSVAYPQIHIHGFGDMETDQILNDFLDFNSYGENKLIICDCSSGKARHEILEQFLVLKMKYDIVGLFPCEDGLYTLNMAKGAKRVHKLEEIRRKTPLEESQSAIKRRTAYVMLGNVIRNLKNQRMESKIVWDSLDPLNYMAKKRGELPMSLKNAVLPFAGKKADIICVGAGGTGGNVIKEIIPLLLKNKGVTLTIVDGDRVEEKNLERQAFSQDDIQSFKSEVLAQKIRKAYPVLEKRVSAVAGYIDTVEQMPAVKHYPILIGAVDNHRARQIFVRWFQMQRDGIWIDSANEFAYGEVVVSIRFDGKNISPLRSDIFPDVLTDHSPSASEISCGAINKTSPQHQLTNLVAAGTVVAVLEEAFNAGKIQGGIMYFDALDGKGVYTKRQPLYTKEVKAYAN